MDVIQVIGIGIITVFLSVLIRQHRPELALALPILGTAVIFLLLAPGLRAALAMFEDIAAQAGIENQFLRLVIKIIGIAYICQFSAEICRDAGESSMAGKIELAGKLMILTLSMPIIYQILGLVGAMIDFS
ncbi:stage III sporulation protein AD [Ructibacterium gallinarum]|uniref:Stage III sporulation protein AD n=1 Tax=Ructibacterium gallinarum TaxID=2779355 RepID=A0A9D5M5R3_9FIRM|nr:stage III sporulation protein AD [Ructibacterium gallinarum]MBE5041120.1 stage III sporulation protein AD [Ructibacterium gallinarum]